MGQAGRFHDAVHPDSIESLLAEEPSGDLDDALTIFGELLATGSHRTAPN
jgi:hypothetical protein